jgi:hypothetical protein
MGVAAEDDGVAAVVSERELPFHWFPKMESAPPVAEVPSTSHTLVATHETEVRLEVVTPVGTETVTSVQAVPFHVSARGPTPVPPTARQNDGPTQETERRVSPLLAGTLTLGTTLHVVPFHVSASDPPPAVTFWTPTAAQNEELVHEMLFSWFDPAPAAAWASDHCTAPTVGGLVRLAAPAGGATRVATVQATNAPVVAISDPMRRMSAPSSRGLIKKTERGRCGYTRSPAGGSAAQQLSRRYR